MTFNGRTFDLPLLETRYLLARASWWGATSPTRTSIPSRGRSGAGARRIAGWRPSRERARPRPGRGPAGRARAPGLLPLPPTGEPGAAAADLPAQPLGPGRPRGPPRAGGRAPRRPGPASRSRGVDGRGALARAPGARPERALLRGRAPRRPARRARARGRLAARLALAAGGAGRRGAGPLGGDGGARRAPAAPAPDRSGEASRAPGAGLRRRARSDAGGPRGAEAWELAAANSWMRSASGAPPDAAAGPAARVGRRGQRPPADRSGSPAAGRYVSSDEGNATTWSRLATTRTRVPTG